MRSYLGLSAPQRTCVGCRRKAEAGELVRITVSAAGDLVSGGPSAGRGAWICGADCLETAQKRSNLGRALRRPVLAGAVERLLDGREAWLCEDVGPQKHGGLAVED